MTAVYRLYDADDALLYVGVANRPAERWGTHANRPWWTRVARTEITQYPTREEALRGEAKAIRAEHPLHNQVVPNPDGSVRGAHLREDSPALATRRNRVTVKGKAVSPSGRATCSGAGSEV